jgi:hypothetical protein
MNSDWAGQHPVRMWELVNLGHRIHGLRESAADFPLLSTDEDSMGVIDRLDALLADLACFELPDSDEVARRWLNPLLFRLRWLYEGGQTTVGDNVTDLQDGLHRLWEALRSEASRRYVYPVKPSRSIAAERLITQPSLLFELEEALYALLPSQADTYIGEAARCLAVGFGPAAGLCLVLTVEAVLKSYCAAVVGWPAKGERTTRRKAWSAVWQFPANAKPPSLWLSETGCLVPHDSMTEDQS